MQSTEGRLGLGLGLVRIWIRVSDLPPPFLIWPPSWHGPLQVTLGTRLGYVIEIIDIECGLLSRVSQKIVATKWRIYKGKMSSPQDILCKRKR